MEEARRDVEVRFWNEEYGGDGEGDPGVYSIVQSSREQCERELFTHCRGKRILEYGCGMGTYSIPLAEKGARVSGIDISDVAIEAGRARARAAGLENVDFQVMDAEAMTFPDGTFDLVCGRGILHHLNLDRSLSEIARVLKEDGKAVFIEPMGHNPAINLYRRMTPDLRVEDEHPLTVRDLKLMKRYFQEARFSFFHLFAIGAVPFRRRRAFPRLLHGLDTLDRALLKWLPFLQPLAWQVVLVLEKPRRDGA